MKGRRTKQGEKERRVGVGEAATGREKDASSAVKAKSEEERIWKRLRRRSKSMDRREHRHSGIQNIL